MPRPSRRPSLTEVQAAVDDILHGTSVDTGTEWLQREYMRMMRREATLLSKTRELESKCADNLRRDGDGAAARPGHGKGGICPGWPR